MLILWMMRIYGGKGRARLAVGIRVAIYPLSRDGYHILYPMNGVY